jgi:hypothetical protein
MQSTHTCRIPLTLKFSGQIFEKSEIPNFTKICLVEAELFHADRRTDRHVTKLIVCFHSFANKKHEPLKCALREVAQFLHWSEISVVTAETELCSDVVEFLHKIF